MEIIDAISDIFLFGKTDEIGMPFEDLLEIGILNAFTENATPVEEIINIVS